MRQLQLLCYLYFPFTVSLEYSNRFHPEANVFFPLHCSTGYNNYFFIICFFSSVCIVSRNVHLRFLVFFFLSLRCLSLYLRCFIDGRGIIYFKTTSSVFSFSATAPLNCSVIEEFHLSPTFHSFYKRIIIPFQKISLTFLG